MSGAGLYSAGRCGMALRPLTVTLRARVEAAMAIDNAHRVRGATGDLCDLGDLAPFTPAGTHWADGSLPVLLAPSCAGAAPPGPPRPPEYTLFRARSSPREYRAAADRLIWRRLQGFDSPHLFAAGGMV